MKYRRIASLKTVENFKDYLHELDIELPVDGTLQTGADAELAQKFALKEGFEIGNRFAILPMEGWDGTREGKPSEETRRRWYNFGKSGAKLIWGGEAVAVRHDGRANPNQLLINDQNLKDIESLRKTLYQAHSEHYSETNDLYVGLQLTHSGRFSKPEDHFKIAPRTVYEHPVLDRKLKVDPQKTLLSDGEIEAIIEAFVKAARQAQEIGFHFVDVKHCHGYLGHEFLSAIDRPGKYGGDFANRTRFFEEIAQGIASEAPGLKIAVRLSAFDWIPFHPGDDGIGTPEQFSGTKYPYAFGGDGTGTGIDLTEPIAFLQKLQKFGVELVCLSAGSPYYNPHIQRPALFPPSDGYQPPEDPLVGVARQIGVTAQIKQQFPELAIVGTGYSYLQEYLPNVAQAVLRQHKADFVGLGRMVLSYPELPADVLSGHALKRKAICRTFSDCTTAPRNGIISGCYPLDEFYKSKPEAEKVKEIKKEKP